MNAPEWGRHLLPAFFTPELVAQFTKVGAWKNYDVLKQFGWSRDVELSKLQETRAIIKKH